MDGGAWWAAVHGVMTSRTRLSDFTYILTFMHWRRKRHPTPVSLPGESQGQGSLVGCRLWGRTGSNTTEATQQQQHSSDQVDVTLAAPLRNPGLSQPLCSFQSPLLTHRLLPLLRHSSAVGPATFILL